MNGRMFNVKILLQWLETLDVPGLFGQVNVLHARPRSGIGKVFHPSFSYIWSACDVVAHASVGSSAVHHSSRRTRSATVTKTSTATSHPSSMSVAFVLIKPLIKKTFYFTSNNISSKFHPFFDTFVVSLSNGKCISQISTIFVLILIFIWCLIILWVCKFSTFCCKHEIKCRKMG